MSFGLVYSLRLALYGKPLLYVKGESFPMQDEPEARGLFPIQDEPEGVRHADDE
jgi:hypothetical protein